MIFRHQISLVVLVVSAAVSTQARAAITTDLGVLAPGTTFGEEVIVDPSGDLGFLGAGSPETLVLANNAIYPYPSATVTGQYDLTFSLSRASTLVATGSSDGSTPGVAGPYGTASVSLLDGSKVLATNLDGSQLIKLSADTVYTLALSGTVPSVAAPFSYPDPVGDFTDSATISPVPLPAAFPMFGAALLGLMGLAAGAARSIPKRARSQG